MNTNKLIALILALAMLVQFSPSMVPAANAAEAMTITVSSAEAKPGDTVTLTVSLSNNTGFSGFTLRTSYDTSALTLTSFAQGEVLNAVDMNGLITNVSVGIANWASTKNATGNGTLMTMVFTVNSDAPSGDYTVSLSAEDFFRVDDRGRFWDCSAQIVAGTVSVSAGEHVHEYTANTVPPTCTEQGYTTHTCSCGDSYVDTYVPALGHSYENGICTRCGEPYVAFLTASISLSGNIGINFYMDLGEAVLADENAYMRFQVPSIDGGFEERTVRVADAKTDVKNGVTRYIFSCDVHAKQMGDMVTAQMCLGDGTPIGPSKQYSVLTYAGYIIEHENVYSAYPTLVALLKTMLNYGAYSQINLSYNTGNLVNAGLGLTLEDVALDQVESFRARKAGSVTGLNISSITLILRSETVLRFYFTLSKGYDISDYKFTVAGKYATVQYNPDNGRYYVDVTGIAAKDLDREYGVTVTNADGTESLSVVASAMTYVYQIVANPGYFTQNLKDMGKALYAYSVAANNYFK